MDFKWVSEFFFDKTVGNLTKFIGLIVMILWIIILNDLTWFTSNYYNKNKIENISNLEKIKSDYSKNYYMDGILIEKINSIENSILDGEPMTFKIFNYFRNIILWNIKIDFWYILSIQWFWIIGLIWITKESYQKGIWKLLGTFLVLWFCMYLWYYFILFSYWFFWLDDKGIQLIINYGLPIVIWIVIFMFTKKRI